MKARVGTLSFERAAELFSYCPISGVITRRVTTGGQLAGSVAGTPRKDGYLSTTADGREVLCHRLAWLLHHRSDPAGEIDHRNGDRSDNRAGNLRDSDRSGNNQNRRKPHKNNRLGVLGVRRLESGRFLARIRVNKKLIRLGTHDTQDAASAAYINAKRKLHKGNTL